MKWYGSIENRLEEGRQFVKDIKVGDGVTEYSWSDRDPWEVTRVKDQKHITIRRLIAKRIDKNAWCGPQEYEYISDPEGVEYDIVKRGSAWYTYTNITKEELMDIDRRRDAGERFDGVLLNEIMWAAQFDRDKVMKNGKQTRYHKMNISIGKAEKYYDPSF